MAAILLAFLWLLHTPAATTAHAELARSSPAADAVLGAPPRTVELWMTEAVAAETGSPGMRVLDEAGTELRVLSIGVDPADPRHVEAEVEGIGYGTFTVAWTARSAVDGHTVSGTFAFRVGGTSRAPGAATVEGETPRVWAVLTRWLTFLGAAVAAGGLLAGPLLLRGSEERQAVFERRLLLAAGGALAGALATLAEPLLQSLLPPAGAERPSLGDALAGLPEAWRIRVPALAVAGLAAIVLNAVVPRHRWTNPIAVAGGAAALAAMLGLSFTSHAAARDEWRALAVASDILHQWSVGLWVGGLAVLALTWRELGEIEPGSPSPLRRFSRYALGLVAVGVATGVVNAGFVLPALRFLWESDYGRVLIAKVALLVPALALATFHRVTLRRAAERVAGTFRGTLRVESAIVLAVVLGGTVIALLAPPSAATGTMPLVDLAAPLAEGGGAYARLRIDPADAGENRLAVAVTDGVPVDVVEGGQLVEAPMATGVDLVRLTMTSLDHATAPTEVQLTPGAGGWFVDDTLSVGLDGWWRIEVTVRRPGVEDASAPFYVVLPDPNVHGFDATDPPATDEAARAMFERGLAGLTGLHSVHFVERLGGGTGTVVTSEHTVHDGTTGQPAAVRIATNESEMVRMDGSQWLRRTGEEWRQTGSGPLVPPAEWGADYGGATGFRLGPREAVGQRGAQMVTFSVPETTLAPAWYAWWVDVETGHLLRETMVSRGHYMLREFDAFDAAPPVVAPEA